jgi:hypothetical protein
MVTQRPETLGRAWGLRGFVLPIWDGRRNGPAVAKPEESMITKRKINVGVRWLLAALAWGVAVAPAADFTAGDDEVLTVSYYYEVYEWLEEEYGGSGQHNATPTGQTGNHGELQLYMGQSASLTDSYGEEYLGQGRHREARLVATSSPSPIPWSDFEETVQTQVLGEWAPPEDQYYVDEQVNQNRAVRKLIKRGKRWNGYEKDVTETWEDDFEFRTVNGTQPRP